MKPMTSRERLEVSNVSVWQARDGDGLWDWNLVTNRIHFSPRWLAFVGCTEHDTTHTPELWLERIHPEDRDAVRQQLAAARSRGLSFDSHHRLRHHDGTYRWMACRAHVVRDETGRVIRLTGAHADASVASVADAETGLPNRLLLLDRIAHAIERGHRHSEFLFAVLLVDLGRPQGVPPKVESAVLASVARRLETCLRTPDQRLNNDLVAHLDGDTFAVLLQGLDEVSDASAAAERILATLLPSIAVRGHRVFLTVTIGIALSATGYRAAEDMVRDASTAAYRARTLGSHCEVFDTVLVNAQYAERVFERELSSALEGREFYLVYQPIVSLESPLIVGFEALVRWRHPSRGVIAPAEFIPLAERTGVIVPLGAWILREACRQLKRWQVSSPALWMSVNLSRAQLKHPSLVQEIAEALSEAEVSPASVALELTEGMAMDDPVAVKTLLMQLRAMGVRVSIDDFGTGYSSLACLRDLPVDTIKIDHSFIRGMEHDGEKAAIARTLTGMARELGLSVIAEGIENDAQLAFLRTLRCDAVQGFFFGRPLVAEAATDLLKAGLSTPCPSPRPTRLSQWRIAAAVLLIVLTIGATGRLITKDPLTHESLAVTATPPIEDVPRQTVDPVVPPFSSDTRVVPKAVTLATPAVEAVKKTEAVPATPRSPEHESLTIAVQHLHRLGTCRGQLTVSQKGLAFAPDQSASEDAFSLTYHELLVSTIDTVLIVKSENRTYRFKLLTESKQEAARELQKVSDRIATLRQ